MRVLVTGGCTFNERDWLWAGLDLLHSMSPITEIIENGEPGAAVRAAEWSQRRLGKEATTVEAEWERYGQGLKMGQKNPAGVIRDTAMAKMRPDVVLVCSGASAAGMLEVAMAHRLKVVMLDRMPVSRG